MLQPLLRDRVQERIGAEGDSGTLAMRILVCNFVGIRNELDLRRLLPMQCIDGGWEIGWIYRYGLTDILVGNRGLTTALAMKAIEVVAPLSLHIGADALTSITKVNNIQNDRRRLVPRYEAAAYLRSMLGVLLQRIRRSYL